MIPVNEPLLDGNEKKYLIECIETGWISSEGPFVQKFERLFAERVGRKHAIAVSNGTTALDASIEALGLGPGDEVLVPSFTIISCLMQIVRAGATPVVVESDPVTWNLDVADLGRKITPKTKAIMVVHTYGLPVDMDPVMQLAQEHGLFVIEDAAEAHGQLYRGKACGSFGDLSTFSFYPNKHVTTGEGGMVLTDSDELAESCRSLRNLCFQRSQRFVHERLGFNLRMTNLQAAVGLAQLERLDEFVSKKKGMGAKYQQLLADLDGVQLPLEKTEYAENHYWVFGLVLGEHSKLSAKQLQARLGERKIGTRPFFFPMHKQPVFLKRGLFQGDECPVAERLGECGLYLPSGMALTEEQQEEVAVAVRSLLK